MDLVKVFLDEGALDGTARFPSACAVVVKNDLIVAQQIEELIHELSLQPDFQLERGASLLEESGFHHVDDNFLAAESFRKLLPKIDFEWWCSSNLEPGKDPYDQLPDQFSWLVTGIMQKYKHRKLEFVFEQNSRLNPIFAKIVENGARNAKASPELASFRIGTKADKVLSIADYCMAYASQAIMFWVSDCCDTAKFRSRFQYRNFALLETACSTLFAANYNKAISNRSTRMLDHAFPSVSGVHQPSCTQK
ncbi:hypothetical protein [Arthrobacter sp. NPDC093139]|uniref:hypothetical protein n=1 Tax=Arthrobacter sp. NPDC093139 TaxID=3363945 RepID=UPI003810A385